MTLTRAFDELASLGLGEVVTEGRERVLRFSDGKKDLWQRSREFMRSPVCPDVHQNNDNLSLVKDAFDNVFEKIWQFLVELTQPNLTTNEFYQAVANDALPIAYKNLLLIAAADSARRRGWDTEMNWAIEKCSNPQLVSLIQSWVERWPQKKLNIESIVT